MKNKIDPLTVVKIDMVRVSACLLVVLLHTVVIGMSDSSAPGWNLLNVIESFTRMSVPLFIMLTGGLLIKESSGVIGSLKRTKRLFLVLFFWSAFYFIYRSYMEKFPFDIVIFFKLIIGSQIFYHLWYLYAAIGFLIMIPLLSSFYLRSTKYEIMVFVSVWASILFLGLINIYFNLGLNITNVFQITLFSSLGVYLLIGKIVLDELTNISKIGVLSACFTLAICTSATAMITKHITPEGGSVNQLFYDNSSLFVGISAICFMIIVMNSSDRIMKFDKALRFLSPCTLGIYLVHPFIIDITRRFIIDKYHITPSIFILAPISIAVFIFSTVIVICLKKVGLSRVV
ncbi:acyltransferase [Salmonella enterica]|uniref:acyltransferase n=1 Tax=Salmonella enterica TaxID=28901 RepID=UPI0003BD93D6|nr:acyltransferase family protein [Salmonella enterica]EAO4731848.1 acyltransferase [Salmonella enterica subsp. enterica serovar Soerenga]ECD9301676.1 acyltransferase family protein [Salmonella enterica subsp. salamae]EAZ5962748.1 acyltransferase [Salmonella enterica]EAZ5972514.1 acyltransferase [Salmonella enterica]EAZ5979178.1 acyltransferase [Salmonella enterica]